MHLQTGLLSPRDTFFTRSQGYDIANLPNVVALGDSCPHSETVAVVAMIETKEGVDSIDEILAVEGIDGVFIGPYDMSGSYGIPGETGSPIVRDACRRIVEACERASKSAGLHIVKPTPQATQQALEDGFTLICLGIDTVFVQEGACAAKALTSNAD